MPFDTSSRARLSPRDLRLFPDDTLFHRVGRVVCGASCLPRKELFESWEVARRARRRLRGRRVVDLACGHALAAHLMLLLDDTSPSALAVDVRLPPSAAKIAAAMTREWPRLAERVSRVTGAVEDVALTSFDVVVSIHACGALTDRVIAHAIAARAAVVLLPCCQDATAGDQGAWAGGSTRPSPSTSRGRLASARRRTRCGRSAFPSPSLRRTGCSSPSRRLSTCDAS